MVDYPATGYIMEHPREGVRLEKKVNPEAWVEKYLSPHLSLGADLLSVGCGPGVILKAASELHPSIWATGLDISVERIREAIQKTRDNPRLHFVFGDAHQMQFPANSFDVVYSRMLMQYVPDKELVLKEMMRVCRPGGVVLLQDLDGQLMWHYPEDPDMQRIVGKVMTALGITGFDPFVGRKLFWLARKTGLENIQTQVEVYHLIAGECDPEILAQWEMKLEIAKPRVAEALGSEWDAEQEIRRFLDYLAHPDTLTYSNVFTVTGEKPL